MKKILYLLSIVLCGGIIFASQPLFQGQYTIDGVDGDTNTGWRLTGTFEDASLLGYGASDCATNDRIYVYSSFGDLDLYRITNLVSVAGSSLSVDVVYDETGTPRDGAPVAGIQIMCRPGYDGYASFLPSLTFGQFTEYLQNGARNLNLKYAIMYAATNQNLIATFNEGATNYVSVANKTNLHVSFKTNYLTSETYLGTLTGATITASSSDGVVVTGPNAAFTWNTNSAGGGGVGTITNMANDAVTSIVWTSSGGPQPIGSVTAYVASVAVAYGTTGQVAALQGATNALNTRAGNLETSTGTLNIAVGNLNTATNSLNGRVSGIEANTTKWETAYTDAASATGNVVFLQGATNTLNTRVGNLETATNTLNIAVGNLNTATNNLNGRIGGMEGNTGKWETAYTDSSAATNDIVGLKAATNALNTRATNLEGATGSLNTAVGNLNTATNNINTRVTGLEGQTNLYYPASNPSGFVTSAESEPLWTADSNNVWTAIGNLDGATNALEGRVAGLEGATGDYYQASNPDGFVAGLIKVGNTTTTQGKIYQQLSDGTWQACYNTNVEYCNKAIGIAYGTNSSSAGMVVIGAVTVTNNDLIIGSNIYVGATAGEWTQTTPSTDGSIIRAVGHAKNTNEIYVTPSPVWVEVGNLISEDTDFNTYNATNIGVLAAESLQITGLSGNGVVPVGAIQMYGTNTAPAGWLLCDGTSVATSTYPALFAVIGGTYGTTNAAWFNLPDMRGVFPKGAGTTSRTLGKDANGNYYSATNGAYLTDKMQGHKHSSVTNLYAFGTISDIAEPTAGAAKTVGAGALLITTVSAPITDGVNGTPRTGMTTEPQSLGVQFIIKY